MRQKCVMRYSGLQKRNGVTIVKKVYCLTKYVFLSYFEVVFCRNIQASGTEIKCTFSNES